MLVSGNLLGGQKLKPELSDIYCKLYTAQRTIPVGTLVTYDDIYKNPNEQENKMELVNTKVFEYCIVNFNEDDSPYVVIGPSAIATIGEENPRDAALLKIGCKHSDIINDDSEVQIRPFC